MSKCTQAQDGDVAMSVNAPIEPLSFLELLIRKAVRFFRWPLMSITTRIVVTAVFLSDLPETAKKWWFLIVFLFADVIMGLFDVARQVPRLLQVGCAGVIEALNRWAEGFRKAAERADRIFGDD
jgi:hypothetical protein